MSFIFFSQCTNYSPGLSSLPPKVFPNFSVTAVTVLLIQLIVFPLVGWGHLLNVLQSPKCRLNNVLCVDSSGAPSYLKGRIHTFLCHTWAHPCLIFTYFSFPLFPRFLFLVHLCFSCWGITCFGETSWSLWSFSLKCLFSTLNQPGSLLTFS